MKKERKASLAQKRMVLQQSLTDTGNAVDQFDAEVRVTEMQRALMEANAAISSFEEDVQTMKGAAKKLFDAVLSPAAEQKVARVLRFSGD